MAIRDPATASTDEPALAGPLPLLLAVGERAAQRRWTVLIRLVLLIPQFVVIALLGIAAEVVVVVGWFGALFTGRLPDFARDYLTGYLRWTTRVSAYQLLLTDRYPPFSLGVAPDYPVQLVVKGDRLNRWAVLFRFILVIPAVVVAAFALTGLSVALVVVWLIVLIAGRMPSALFGATTTILRFQVRVNAFYLMLTACYPRGLFGDPVLSPSDATMPTLGDPAIGDPAISDPVLPAPGAPALAEPTPPVPGDPALPGTAPPPGSGSYVDAPSRSLEQGWGPPPPPVPYAAPSSIVRPLAPPAATRDPWRIVLSRGAKVLVVVFLILGPLAIVGEAALSGSAINRAQARDAQQQMVAAYTTLSDQVSTFSERGAACRRRANPVPCLRNNDADIAQSLTTFSGAIQTIDYPSSAVADAERLDTTATTLASALAGIAETSGGAVAYDRAVKQSGLTALLSDLDRAYQQLSDNLANSA